MRIVKLTDDVTARVALAYGLQPPGGNPAAIQNWQKAKDAVIKELNAPVDLGACRGVQHDNRTKVYSATFACGVAAGEAPVTATVRLADDVAEFILANMRVSGRWMGRLQSGTLIDVYLLVT